MHLAQSSGTPIDLEMQQDSANPSKKPDPTHKITTPLSQDKSQLNPTLANSINATPAVNNNNHLPNSNLASSPQGPSSPLLAGYESDLRNRIEGSLKYPTSLRRRRIQGSSMLRIQIPSQGGQVTVEITKSSGFPELDELALQAAMTATPFPAPPIELLNSQATLTVQLPIEFKLSP